MGVKKGKALKLAASVLILIVLASFAVRLLSNTTGVPPSSTATTTQACPPPLPGPSASVPHSDVNGTVGAGVRLDATSFLSNVGSGYAFRWSQVYANATELDYVTNFAATLSNSTGAVATMTAREPGNYRIQLEATPPGGQTTLRVVDVSITDPNKWNLDAKGVIFGDVFNNLGGPDFNMGPYPNPCQQERFTNALAAPLRVGAGWVGYVPAEFYTRVSPSPQFAGDGNDLSLTNDTYYYGLMAAAHSEGFKIVEFVQYGVGPGTPTNQSALLPLMYNSSSWWSSWFDAWKQTIIAEAERAQKAGVEMLVLCLYCDDTFRPQVFPNYAERWDDIIASVRQVYAGKLAMSLIVSDDRFTMYSKLDAVFMTIFPGLYLNFFKDPQNPTMSELQNQTARMLSYGEWMAGKINVYYILTADSSNGQYDPDPPPWAPNPPPANLTDFREQAMYYEAFLSVLRNQSWVSGFFSERWDYFDHFARTGETPSAYYFDQTIGSSPRSKPAEQVVKLWFSLAS